MNIAIITAEFGENASTLDESVNCYFQYGNFNYNKLTLKNGFLKESLDQYDVIIIHYSCIALPLKHSLPINAITSLYLSEFKGPKIAFIQDEQRSYVERFNYFQSIKINHLFSVAPIELFDVLYPSNKRNFTINNVLTGYISNKHIEISRNRIPLVDRSLDLVYRGRILPSWMGDSPALKSEAVDILKKMNSMKQFNYSVASNEKERVYGDKWFSLLQSARVSLLTQSGSDFLEKGSILSEAGNNYDINDEKLLKANYHVISPRYFDYISCGNLVAIAPGHYSNIPIENTYSRISNDMHEMPEIINFAKTKSAQVMVDTAQSEILTNKNLHFSYLVKVVEEKISDLIPTKSMVSFTDFIRTENPGSILTRRKIHKNIKILNHMIIIMTMKLFIIKILKKILKLDNVYLIRFVKNYDFKTIRYLLKLLPGHDLRDYLKLGLIVNTLELFELSRKINREIIFSKFNFDNSWVLNLGEYGSLAQKEFTPLEEKLGQDKNKLYDLITQMQKAV